MKSLNGAAVVAAWGALATGGAVHAQEAVQWRVEDGGNGHWYREVFFDGYSNCGNCIPEMCQSDALVYTASAGGYLVNINNLEEGDFLSSFATSPCSGAGAYWIGLLYSGGSTCDIDSWQWSEGEPIDPAVFSRGEWCEYSYETSSRFEPSCDGNPNWYLNNTTCTNAPIWGLIVEWSADCNGDGIVDYGQILDGTYADANGNGVPDCCDKGVDCDPCLGDVNFDGIVNGADISVLLGFWGLNGKPVAADINNDGQVDGADLAQLLGSWGECP